MNTAATPDVLTRFWPKVAKTEGGCWIWLAAKDQGGYGKFKADRLVQAHRFSYELAKGAIPEGLQLDHLCRVRACVNPEHLEPVTIRVNLLRGETTTARRASQTHCERGHEFTPANTYRKPNGCRNCRECRRDSDRRYYARKTGRAA
ncbi:HNH endonuclease signature motif containing protein [Amycolatopsis sp. CFH S0078]|uniref:HNH endonuclease signature motif containing protein n=1 Tax=Amycolatopsis sp. CFH S0078 TaxID=1644108 RepID=UPI00196A6E10|nr:HNH endonuclease signature motif containing protein [Amycolatopsis sp. CFH S0078]